MKNNQKAINILFILFVVITSLNSQSIVINEFMSDNETTIQDNDHNFSDWIELYNTANHPININNYGLYDKKNKLNKWLFPDISIPGKGFLLIYASGKNRKNTNELHTNFKISSNGEKLYLTNNNGVIIDETISIDLANDESYGRIPDGNNIWLKSIIATPGKSNISNRNIEFSHKSGFYTSPFYLKLKSYCGDSVFYTLDGSVPTDKSLAYNDSLLIDYKNGTPNYFSEIPTTPEQNLISYKAWESPINPIDKATILRCASYKNGIQTSIIYSLTFFVDSSIFKKYNMPIISLITEEKNFFNYDSGIYVPGSHYHEDNPEWSGNYFERGDNWERPIHIEYFNLSGKSEFSQDAGVRIHGGKTRQAAQKSLKLYARSEYGNKYFNYQLLPKRKNNKYKRFLLRTSMGAWGGQTIIKDILAHDISRDLNMEIQEFQPVVVYLNGEYWGIHTIRDRLDERYIEYLYNIDNDSVEIFDWTNEHYFNMEKFIGENDLAIDDNYEYVKTQMDINNFIDYIIAEMFFSNIDWPANNRLIWRPKTKSGKWRWVFYDIDGGLGNYEYNMFDHITRNHEEQSTKFIFNKLLKNNTFKAQFISRYAVILNSYFTKQTMIQKLDSIKGLYTKEVPHHITRWNYPTGYSDWENDIEKTLLGFIENRSCYVEKNIINFFDLTNFDFSCSNKKDTTYTNKLLLIPNPNNGYFVLYNDTPIESKGNVTITNAAGLTVYYESDIVIKPKDKKQFFLKNKTNGIYFLNFHDSDTKKQYKFILIN